MRLEEIREVARRHNIKAGRMKKGELVRAIQEAEGNSQCYATGNSATCGQDRCLWREDCD